MNIDDVLLDDVFVDEDTTTPVNLIVGKTYIAFFKHGSVMQYQFVGVSRHPTMEEEVKMFKHYKDEGHLFFVDVIYNDGLVLQIKHPHIEEEDAVRTYEIVGDTLIQRGSNRHGH